MPTPKLIKTRGGIGAAVWLCFLTLGAGGAWAVVDGHEGRRPLHPPPAPTLTAKPPATTKQVWAAFSFSDRKRRIYFQCSLDGAPFRDCSSPVRYGPAVYIGRVRCKGQPKTRRGRAVKMVSGHRHQPAPGTLDRGPHSSRSGPSWATVAGPACVLHVDDPRLGGRVPVGAGEHPGEHAGEQSPEPARKLAPRGRRQRAGRPAGDLRHLGNPEGLMYPGAPARRIPLALSNPNTAPIYVTGLTVSAASENPDCPVEENLLITSRMPRPLAPVLVPAGGSVTLADARHHRAHGPADRSESRQSGRMQGHRPSSSDTRGAPTREADAPEAPVVLGGLGRRWRWRWPA